MKNQEAFTRKIIELIGFDDYTLELDEGHRHARIFIHNHPHLLKENLPAILQSLNHLIQLVAKKENEAPLFFDINNYRREREGLIAELARAAARKAVATEEEISLPAMNSYERRLIHIELAIHPDVTTESVGAGKNRYVVVKPIKEKAAGGQTKQPVNSQPQEKKE